MSKSYHYFLLQTNSDLVDFKRVYDMIRLTQEKTCVKTRRVQ